MPRLTTPDGRRDFQQQLLSILEDPKIKRLALAAGRGSRPGQDALNEAAYCAVARVAESPAIRDLRAYFCKTLINAVNHLR